MSIFGISVRYMAVGIDDVYDDGKKNDTYISKTAA